MMQISSFRPVSLALAVAFSLPAADPDFSGTWLLDESRSDIQRGTLAPPGTLTVQHKATEMDCEAVRNGVRENCSYTIDRKESRHESGGATRSSVAKWEGDTIVLNTIVMKKDGGQHTEMDRWTL